MERIRHAQPEVIHYSMSDVGPSMDNWQVPPLLLVTFIENAFKHGLNAVYEGGWVQITLDIKLSSQGRLSMTVINNKGSDCANLHMEGGIGLANVKRRLSLLYPSAEYTLIVSDQLDQFEVRLSIPLKRKGETIHHENDTEMLAH
jgi:LytS/YehU family sensor histidine kinase